MFSIHFWGFIYIPPIVHKVTNALSLLIMGICFIRTLQLDGLRFRNAIVLLFIGFFINIISAYINQGQAPLESFLNFGTTYFFILFYFLLHDLQPSRRLIENTIIFFAILYSLFYIIQVLAYPAIIFDGEIKEDRGTIRIFIEGNGFLMLAYFLLLNRYFLNRGIFNLLLAFGFFIILLMGGFRTLTFAAVFISSLMFFKLVKYSFMNFAIFVFLALFVVGLFQLKPTSIILNEMFSASKEQKAEGRDYIRLRELHYYLNIYPQNKSYFIMGGGLPGSESHYARLMQIVQSKYGFYWTDLGLIGFYIVIGAVALLGLLWYTIKAIFIKHHPDKLYLNYYFAFLLIVSITTREIFREGIFVVSAIGLYLIDLSYIEEKKYKIQQF